MTIFRQQFIQIFLLAALLIWGAGCEKKTTEPQGEGVESEESAAGAQASGEADAVEEGDEAAEQKRVVSIGGVVTEIVFALGAGEQVVAADRSSVYPEAAQQVATLDLFRQVSAEAIIAQKPDIVLVTEEAEPKEALAQVEAAGIEVVHISEAPGVEEARERIKKVAEALGRSEEGAELVQGLDGELKQASEQIEACEQAARALFIYARGPNTLMVAGEGTSVRALIELAGGEPIPGDISDFKPMSAESILTADPDVILLTDSGLKSLGGLKGLREIKGLASTRAVKEERVVTHDDLALLGFGPRLGEVVRELAGELCLDEAAPGDAAAPAGQQGRSN